MRHHTEVPTVQTKNLSPLCLTCAVSLMNSITRFFHSRNNVSTDSAAAKRNMNGEYTTNKSKIVSEQEQKLGSIS